MPRLYLAMALLLSFVSAPALALQQVDLLGEVSCGTPLDVALDETGNVITVQKGGTVVIATAEGRTLRTLGGKDAAGKLLLKKPTGVAWAQGQTYVVDRSAGQVVIFSGEGSLLSRFGRRGSGPREFDDPMGIAVHGGVIYVADRDNGRVQVFGPNGVYLHSIGSEGPEETLLKKPVDVAIDGRGFLFVADGGHRRVMVYRPDGAFQQAIGELGDPRAIDLVSDGLLVADAKKAQVVKYSFEGERLFSFGSKGKGRGQFLALGGIAVGGDGQIYAADSKRGTLQTFQVKTDSESGDDFRAPPPTSELLTKVLPVAADQLAWDRQGRLLALDRKGKKILALADGRVEREIPLAGFKPVAFTQDAAGNLWVLDHAKKQVVKLDDGGNSLFAFGSSGSREGSFSWPKDLVVSKRGAVIVADTGNGRVQIFNSDGLFLETLGKDSGSIFERPTALSLDGRDSLYVLDEGRKVVSVFSAEGVPLLEFGGAGSGPGRLLDPVDVAANGNEIFVLDAGSCSVKAFDTNGAFLREFGSKGEQEGEFRRPTSLALQSDLELWVADPEEERIQGFTSLYTPASPENISARAGMREVRLRWDNSPQTYVKAYRVYRSDFGQKGFEKIAEVYRPAYQDAQVKPGLTYTYRVTAVAKKGQEGPPGDEARAKATKFRPSAPRDVRASALPWEVALSWRPNREEFVDHYAVYRKGGGEPRLVGETREPSFVDVALDPETAYTFLVAAVSTDSEESTRTAVTVTTPVATRPPVEIYILEMQDIFSSNYKIYENEGIGLVRVTNNTSDHISRLKVFFTIKDFMDFPSEVEIEDLPPAQGADLALRAVFNNNILGVSEDTPVQTEIRASYFRNGEDRTFSRHHTLNLYEKHRMIWDVEERFATFINPKDPLLLDLSRGVAVQVPAAEQILPLGGALFETLGLLGLTYVQDPSNPYQVASGNTRMVDYVQYPRETLERRSGDCDDLVGLYCALLESLGIRTQVLAYPGHMFMMFDTGLDPDADLGPARGLLVEQAGTLWAPLEVTEVGASFMTAWESGSKAYRMWEGRGLTRMDIRQAWERFKPASLPPSEWRADPVAWEDLEREFPGEFKSLQKIVVQSAVSRYLARVKENPRDFEALLQLGVKYARQGELGEAIKRFGEAARLDPGNAAVKNNLGNAHFLAGDYRKAQKAYQEAAGLDAGDARIWVNLARAHLKLGSRKQAEDAFGRAERLDPGLKVEYRTIALELAENY
ncbi:tetratricopeptide repeat protein [Desulfuromonas sp.]|uniref:tetratricopeptide repeat protein n=1 Tax=Desulfuromonas sp. TaxID=892 RepID=UPI0025BDC29F|nr:tetratricopeptide repeat protein [Desulfuromonas sp.]